MAINMSGTKVVKFIRNDGRGAGICFKLSQNNPETCQMLKSLLRKSSLKTFTHYFDRFTPAIIS
jgi:hypothetical protein